MKEGWKVKEGEIKKKGTEGRKVREEKSEGRDEGGGRK